MKSISRRLTSIAAVFVAITILFSTASVASAAENATRRVDTIIKQINEEYGLNIHPLSSEELAKYGLVNDSRKATDNIDLDAFEAELRQIAESEIPQFERTTQEALERERSVVSIDIADCAEVPRGGPVVATKAINYATAGATAYITTNNYGAKIWGSVVNRFCSSNMYQSRWFMSLNPSVRKIDGGRTLYWSGYGDYCAYINGTQYYLYSGTQYAEMYVGSYS